MLSAEPRFFYDFSMDENPFQRTQKRKKGFVPRFELRQPQFVERNQPNVLDVPDTTDYAWASIYRKKKVIGK